LKKPTENLKCSSYSRVTRVEHSAFYLQASIEQPCRLVVTSCSCQRSGEMIEVISKVGVLARRILFAQPERTIIDVNGSHVLAALNQNIAQVPQTGRQRPVAWSVPRFFGSDDTVRELEGARLSPSAVQRKRFDENVGASLRLHRTGGRDRADIADDLFGGVLRVFVTARIQQRPYCNAPRLRLLTGPGYRATGQQAGQNQRHRDAEEAWARTH
jgi:hypothetical protein